MPVKSCFSPQLTTSSYVAPKKKSSTSLHFPIFKTIPSSYIQMHTSSWLLLADCALSVHPVACYLSLSQGFPSAGIPFHGVITKHVRWTSVPRVQANFSWLFESPSNYTPSVWHLFTTLCLERIILANLHFLLFTFPLTHSHEVQVNEWSKEPAF